MVKCPLCNTYKYNYKITILFVKRKAVLLKTCTWNNFIMYQYLSNLTEIRMLDSDHKVESPTDGREKRRRFRLQGYSKTCDITKRGPQPWIVTIPSFDHCKLFIQLLESPIPLYCCCSVKKRSDGGIPEA